jgi:hypothetical protein
MPDAGLNAIRNELTLIRRAIEAYVKAQGVEVQDAKQRETITKSPEEWAKEADARR